MSSSPRHRADPPGLPILDAAGMMGLALGASVLVVSATGPTSTTPSPRTKTELDTGSTPAVAVPVTATAVFASAAPVEVDDSGREELLAAEAALQARQRAARAAADAALPSVRFEGSDVPVDPEAITAAKVPDPEPVASPSVIARGGILEAGERYLGIPYLWGGTNPDRGLDCSGFTQLVFRDLGIALPRTSREQARVGTPVSAADARPGDLVFFGAPVHHVGIYAGDGKLLEARKAGVPVGYGKVWSGETIQYRRVA